MSNIKLNLAQLQSQMTWEQLLSVPGRFGDGRDRRRSGKDRQCYLHLLTHHLLYTPHHVHRAEDQPLQKGPGVEDKPLHRGPGAEDQTLHKGRGTEDKPLHKGPGAEEQPLQKGSGAEDKPLHNGPGVEDQLLHQELGVGRINLSFRYPE